MPLEMMFSMSQSILKIHLNLLNSSLIKLSENGKASKLSCPAIIRSSLWLEITGH